MRKHTFVWMAVGFLCVSSLGCGGGGNKVVEATNKITVIETAINQPPYQGGTSKAEANKGNTGSGPGGPGGPSGGPSKGPPGKPN
ncbi:MAG TPA: hypothetical protein PLX97_00475 [Gemmatales bacterium]|nr:hypothetical protein [Gemmatales bacterium]